MYDPFRTSFKTVLPALLGLSLLLMSGNAHAVIPFFVNQKNLASDNTAGYLINKPGSQPGDVTLDVGDRIRGQIRIETIEDVTGGGGTRNLLGTTQATEFTAIYDLTVISKSFVMAGPAGPMYQFTYGPTPPAVAWAGLPGPTPAAGSLVRFYEDSSRDYRRILASGQTDDGDPTLNGADIGTTNTLTEELLIATATNGTPYWDLGFTGPLSAGYGGQPSPLAGEGWSSFSIDNFKVARSLPLASNGGLFNFGLNLTANFTGPQLNLVDTSFGGQASISGSGSIIGIAGAPTPFDYFSNVDFTLYPNDCSASIGDLVWKDLNRNGIQDAGEPGITGAKITLTDTATNAIIQTVTTNADGNYLFKGLCAGNYMVMVDETTLPADLLSTTSNLGPDRAVDSNGSPAAVTLLTNTSSDLTIDFGYIPPCTGSIGDFVWHDLDRNGIQNIGEPGIDGVTVNLLDYKGNLIQTANTANGGSYLFAGLCPGDFTVSVETSTLPAGYTPTTVNAPGSDFTNDSNESQASVTLAEGEKNITIDFGYITPCTGAIGDFVWHDQNRDGIQNASEPGINGVTLFLKNPADNSTLATTTTDANGFYMFEGLCGGDYKVEIKDSTLPADFVPTITNAPGSTSANDSNGSPTTISLPIDAADLTIDFGYISPCDGSIGDFVWNDLNRNGIQDAGEPGISGVTVLLKNPTNNVTLATTTTDANGLYLFGGLCGGSYKVEVNTLTLPAGFLATITNALGSTSANDNNGSPTTVGLLIDATDVTIDFGYYMVTGQGCSLTWGYWKTHSEFGPAPYDNTWAQLPNGASTPFFISGQTWYQVLRSEPRGNAYYILAHQFAAAYLNKLNGADISAIGNQLTHAEELLKTYKPTDKLTAAVRNDFIGIAYTLDQYNNGNIGPGHCQDSSRTCTNGSGRKSNDHKSH